MTSSPLHEPSAYRRFSTATLGLVRVEVEAPKDDVGLIRALAETLCSDQANADLVRASIQSALERTRAETAFDVFGSDLPDQAFDGVFETTRDRRWREAAF